jgi:hypothetical protein
MTMKTRSDFVGLNMHDASNVTFLMGNATSEVGYQETP